MAESIEVKPAKVVQNGKVYRQIFDAEVQLVKSLKKTTKDREQKGVQVKDRDGGKPSVPQPRDDTEGTGLLTSRQRTWVEGFPNEQSIENPVLYRQVNDYLTNQSMESFSTLAGREVRGLPDVVIPAKTGSDIIDRIAESRRVRHEAALEDMRQEIGMISTELEPRITEAGNLLLSNLAENNTVIEQLMKRIEKDEDLFEYTLVQLHELWDEIQSQSEDRRQWVSEMDGVLLSVEKERMGKIRLVFEEYAKTLEKISHLMKPDIQRLLDSESQMINQAVLSNKRAYADLFTRLMTADIEREKKHHNQWQKRLEDWRQLNTNIAVKNFTDFMKSDVITAPSGVNHVLTALIQEQDRINQKRLELINSLREMLPPSSTKTRVYQWNDELKSLSDLLDQTNQQYLKKLYEEYEYSSRHSLQEMEEVRKSLLQSGVCDDTKAHLVVTESLMPLIGQRQRLYEAEMEEMEKHVEEHTNYMNRQLKSLFKYCQGAAHAWDLHEIGLGKQERALQEKLETCRHHHDNINQEREANLDITMDRMRQDGNESHLEQNLKRALEMLTTIKLGYEEFHSEQRTLVEEYPTMVQDELNSYDHALCRFFGIDRRPPEEVNQERQEEADKLREENAGSPHPPNKFKQAQTQMIKKKKHDDEDQDDALPRTPIPLTLVDMMKTAKGTNFYILTEAGECGIPPEGAVEAEGSRSEINLTFLTETGGDEKKTPEYITKQDIPDEMFFEFKKIIRLNFLDHYEEWVEQAIDRANSVVAAKTEELNSELDLRLHLHAPRAKRAELDVHHVRAAELVMHSERVSRHCKGIHQTLTDLKMEFTEMTHGHNKLFEKFRADIEELEVVFINATKSSKLVALQNQLQVELDKFMTQIRTSLRHFRQHLDDTLQMLRESNARFIKSFKLFSEGGNFCPEEIEDYRKRLEKMSSKIDTAEGFVMSDLEGMESKRLDQATKVSNEFEDRFKNHMIDLIFMEKISRWLTNTQVKIKAEVADSNSQAQRLAQILIDLDRRIDACEKPNLDKETVTPSQLKDSLTAIFETFHERSMYLHCVREPQPRPSTPQLVGIPAVTGARVGFAADVSLPNVSKPGRQPIEDPCVGTIKNILKTQRSKARFGPDADLDGENLPQPQNPTGGATKSPSESLASPMLSEAFGVSDRDKSKSGMSRVSATSKGSKVENGEKSKQSSRKGTASTTAAAEGGKRQSSACHVKKQRTSYILKSYVLPVDYDLMHDYMRRKKSFFRCVEMHRCNKSQPSNVRRSIKLKYDRRFLVFGERDESGEDVHLTGRILRILRSTLDGLLAASELYYRQKGPRLVTRPQALQETFDQCAEIICAKLQSYEKQANEYHNQCLQEFRGQLWKLEHLVERIPALLIAEIEKVELEAAEQKRNTLNKTFSLKNAELDKRKFDHKNLLRPGLGHPHYADELSALSEREDARKKDFLQGLENHITILQEVTTEHAQTFVDKLAKMSEELFLEFDNLLTIDDVDRGTNPVVFVSAAGVPPKKYPTSELIRRKNAGLPLEDDANKNALPRGKATWNGVVKNELVVGQKSSNELFTASVTTVKTTLGHSGTLKARDQTYKDYQKKFGATLEDIEEQRQTHLTAEGRWNDSWQESVEKVKQLYSA